MSYIIKPAIALFVTAVIVIFGLSFVIDLTYEPIQIQQRKAQETAMMAVLPQASSFSEVPGAGTGSIISVYEGQNNGVSAGYVVRLITKGYGGNIDMVVGISGADKKITGMRILQHSETPGLGALAAREDFYRRFDNRPLITMGVARTAPGEHDISAITASTITTRAITGAVNEAIEWYLATSGR